MLRRIAPALGLFLLAPLVGEFLLGNIAIDAFATLTVLAPLYGGGALAVREVARRSGRGWPTMLLLAAAYAVIEEGLVTQSLFNPSYFGVDLLGYAPIPALGIGAWWTLFVLTLHTVWSIAVPIAIVEALVPERARSPWLGRAGLAAASAAFLAGAIVSFWMTYDQERFVASAPQLMGTAVVIAALGAAAFAVGRPRRRDKRAADAGRRRPRDGRAADPRRRRPRDRRAAPRPVALGALSFVAASSFVVGLGLLPFWPVVIAFVLLDAAIAAAILRWSARAGWSLAHQLALAGGALLTYAWQAFPHAPIIGSAGAVDLIGNTVFALGAVMLLAAAAVRLRAWRGSAPAVPAAAATDG